MKKLIFPVGVLLITLFVIVFFIFSSRGDEKKDISPSSRNPEIKKNASWHDYSKTLYDPQKEIKQNKQLDIPSKYSSCQEKPNLYECVLKKNVNKEEENIYIVKDSKKIISKLEEISWFKEQLAKKEAQKTYEASEKQAINKISNSLQERYITYFPEFIIQVDANNCKESFCKEIVFEIKKKLIDRLVARNIITNTSLCKKIPENKITNYCNSFF